MKKSELPRHLAVVVHPRAGGEPRRSQIQGIFFDLGGVLVRIDRYYEDLLKKERRLFHVSFGKMDRVIADEVGRIEKSQEELVWFWRRVTRKLNLPLLKDGVAKQLLARSFRKYGSLDVRTLAIAKRLRRSGRYRLGVISNTIDDHVAIMKKWKLFEYFDPVILSNEVGARKPERKIFMIASKRMGIPPGQLLFIDDNPKWLRAARKVGFRTILFKSPAQLKKQLRKFEVSI